MGDLIEDIEDLTITVKISELKELINKEVDQRMSKLGEKILKNKTEHKNGNEYIIHEKDKDGFVVKTRFCNYEKSIIYLETKYKYSLSKSSFLNLIKRLNNEVKRKTIIDEIFRNKILKIESISKKNP